MSRQMLSEQEKRFLSFLNLEEETAKLNKEKTRLIKDVSTESKKLSDLVERGLQIEKKAQDILSSAKVSAELILNRSDKTEDEINSKKSEAIGKIAELEATKKEYEKKIKSTEGLEKNLSLENKVVSELKSKLLKLVDLIKDTMK